MGGKARAAALSPEVRRQIARAAILKRWNKQAPILASKHAPEVEASAENVTYKQAL